MVLKRIFSELDTIEFDELYTFIKKGLPPGLPIWPAYSRRQWRVYEKAKRIVGRIAHISTDGNSCYEGAFKKIPEPHTMTKKETHLIESSNSSIRDNLARFNRRSKKV